MLESEGLLLLRYLLAWEGGSKGDFLEGVRSILAPFTATPFTAAGTDDWVLITGALSFTSVMLLCLVLVSSSG